MSTTPCLSSAGGLNAWSVVGADAPARATRRPPRAEGSCIASRWSGAVPGYCTKLSLRRPDYARCARSGGRFRSDPGHAAEDRGVRRRVGHAATVAAPRALAAAVPRGRLARGAGERPQLLVHGLQLLAAPAGAPLQEGQHELCLPLGVLREASLQGPFSLRGRDAAPECFGLSLGPLQLALEVLAPSHELTPVAPQAVELVLVGLPEALDEALVLASSVHELALEPPLESDELLLVLRLHLELPALQLGAPQLRHQRQHCVPQAVELRGARALLRGPPRLGRGLQPLLEELHLLPERAL
mmetsp:Transcript_107166/g.333063  ORF Transcript_107166/g.333063 Transcript_107166/m.333063 type:complete len:300 (+) Transcript_107166:72-971(+)